MPGIARPMKDGGYEIIAGHRRRHACELVGLTTMPMFISDYTDDEATIIMVDSNIQREDILPSEKAKFPEEYSNEQIENVIYHLLDEWNSSNSEK